MKLSATIFLSPLLKPNRYIFLKNFQKNKYHRLKGWDFIFRWLPWKKILNTVKLLYLHCLSVKLCLIWYRQVYTRKMCWDKLLTLLINMPESCDEDTYLPLITVHKFVFTLFIRIFIINIIYTQQTNIGWWNIKIIIRSSCRLSTSKDYADLALIIHGHVIYKQTRNFSWHDHTISRKLCTCLG